MIFTIQVIHKYPSFTISNRNQHPYPRCFHYDNTHSNNTPHHITLSKLPMHPHFQPKSKPHFLNHETPHLLITLNRPFLLRSRQPQHQKRFKVSKIHFSFPNNHQLPFCAPNTNYSHLSHRPAIKFINLLYCS